MTRTLRSGSTPDTPPWAAGRRTPLDRRSALSVAGIAAGAAVILALQAAVVGISPTGSTASDVLVVAVFAGFVVWAGASAPWWALVVLGAVAAATTGLSMWTLPPLCAVGIGVWTGRSGRGLPLLSAAGSALAMLGLMRVAVDPFFGASAVLVTLVTVPFVGVSVSRRQRFVRRRAVWGGVAVIVLALLAVAGLGAGGLQAQDDLRSGQAALEDGLDQLRAGDTAAAAVSLHAAAASLGRAGDAIGAVWTQPSRLVPVVAHHRSALASVVDSAADAAEAAAGALAAADIDALQVDGGSVDAEALASLAAPMNDLDGALRRMIAVLHDAESPWLAGPVQDGLSEGLDALDSASVQSGALAAAATNGPAMLGNEGARHYLVVFTLPGEARGQSGVISNWAEIIITDGTIRRSASGSVDDLVESLTEPGATEIDPTGVLLDVPAEYLDRYASLGAGGSGEGVTPAYWRNVTVSPDAPTVARVMAQMYEAGGHRPVDGVFIIDPTGLASLLRVAGPVTIDAIDQALTADRLEQFLLFDQYALDDVSRAAAVEAVAGVTLAHFLEATLPAPDDLAAAMGPAATEGHIVGWATRPEEERVFRLVGMSGALAPPEGHDGLAVVTNGSAGDPADRFVQRSVSYTATYDGETGRVDAVVAVTLHNGARAGVHGSTLTVYSPLTSGQVSVDGEAVAPIGGTELGWNTTSVSVAVPAGGSTTVRIELTGVVGTDGYGFVWRPQPTTLPDAISVDVASSDGDVAFDGQLTRTSLVDRNGTSTLR